jgi:hypothetical protein
MFSVSMIFLLDLENVPTVVFFYFFFLSIYANENQQNKHNFVFNFSNHFPKKGLIAS